MAITKKDKGEIVQAYRLAKNQPEQINIAAELYGTNTSEIRCILADVGVYEITPDIIANASRRIIEDGLTFGGLRNYYKAFSGYDAKNAKKVFKDYAHQPWPTTSEPEECNDLQSVREWAASALMAADARAKSPKKKPQDLAPAPCVVREPFTAEQNGLLIAGLIALISEEDATRRQLDHEITAKQEQCKKLMEECDERMREIAELDAKIAEGRALLEQLKEETNA